MKLVRFSEYYILISTDKRYWIFNKSHGFRISHAKMIFHQPSSRRPSITLNLNNFRIPLVESTEFLSLHFQNRHSWLPHIKSIKVKCNRVINCLKYMSHPTTDCNQKVPLSLYKTLVRSILDYGSPIYGLVPPSHLKLHDPVQSLFLRLATGAFRTSPSLSLGGESATSPSTTTA